MGRAPRISTNIAGIDFSSYSLERLIALFQEILNDGIHGICFSAYMENQAPGTKIRSEQIRERMKILQPYVKWVRSFSCTDGNEFIPRIAYEYGLKTLVGAWLGDDPEKNEEEIEGLIKVAREGHADIIAVGNEVMLRGDLSQEQMIEYIRRVKANSPGIPVGYVDAYYEFECWPGITEACDVILANCYPFWEGYPMEHSLVYVKDMYRRAQRAAKGKKVIISETGWPNRGEPFGAAVPSLENALKYFINIFSWAEEEEVEVFYFASFDEAWKVDAEGDVGAYWGLWDKDGNLKFQ